MKPVKVYKKHHRGCEQIFLSCDKQSPYQAKIRKLSNRKFSATNRSWYIPYTKVSWKEFLDANSAYELESTTTDTPLQNGTAGERSTNGKNTRIDAPKASPSVPSDKTKQSDADISSTEKVKGYIKGSILISICYTFAR